MIKNVIKKRDGFSLVELSLVLIIVALIVVGIIGGKALIERGKLSNMKTYTSNFSSRDFNQYLSLWIEPSMPDAYELSSSDVLTVSDQGDSDGFQTDFYASSASASPTYTEGAINGFPAWEFDGVDDCLVENTGVARFTSRAHTIFFVALRTDDSDGGVFGVNNSDTHYVENFTFLGTTGIRLQTSTIGSPTLWSNSSLEDTVVVGAFTYDGTNISFYSNGTQRYSNAAGGSILTGRTLSIGCLKYISGTLYYPFKGYIGEVLVYEKALNAYERGEVEDYLMTKWKVN